MPGDYSEELARLLYARTWGWTPTDEEWDALPASEREHAEGDARAILAALSSSGRLVPEGAKTEWGCATPIELSKQNPVRWFTRESALDHGNCGSCVLVSRLTTPWTLAEPAQEER